MPTVTYDPLATRVASKKEIKEARITIEYMPIKCADGNTFDADHESEQRIKSAINNWAALGVTDIDWRLADNTLLTVDLAQLQAYWVEVQEKRALRGFAVYPEYLTYVADPTTTLRDLEDWKDSYKE